MMNEASNTLSGTKELWLAVKELSRGEQRPREKNEARFAKNDGSLATTDEEHAGITKGHFESTFNRRTGVDFMVLDLLPQKPPQDAQQARAFPSDKQLRCMIRRIKNGKSAGLSKVKPEEIKLLTDTPGTAFDDLKELLLKWWNTGETYESWKKGQLIYKGPEQRQDAAGKLPSQHHPRNRRQGRRLHPR